MFWYLYIITIIWVVTIAVMFEILVILLKHKRNKTEILNSLKSLELCFNKEINDDYKIARIKEIIKDYTINRDKEQLCHSLFEFVLQHHYKNATKYSSKSNIKAVVCKPDDKGKLQPEVIPYGLSLKQYAKKESSKEAIRLRSKLSKKC